MNKILWEEYNTLYNNEKLDIMRKEWGLKDNCLLGQLNFKDLDKGFFILRPFNLNLETIYYPYTYRKDILEGVIGFINENNIVENLYEDDDVILCFEFVLNEDTNKKQERPIKVKAESVKVLGNYWSYLEELGFEREESIFNKIVLTNTPEDKFYFVKDLKELYSCYEDGLKEDVDKFQMQLNEIFSKLDIKRKELEGIEKEINELETKRAKLKKLGFNVDLRSDKDNPLSEVLKTKELNVSDHISYIKNYLKNKERLFYSEDIITRFYNGIKVNQMLLLSGPPGTGKTSLVTSFAKSINAECKVISVKSNWMDDEDLLGFFNPIDNLYVPTPFLDFIAEARIDEENGEGNVYIVCLDEMNLANIEYYFSEFITKLELDEPFIELYSEYTYNILYKEIWKKVNRMNNEIEGEVNEVSKREWCKINNFDYEVFQKTNIIWENLRRYPAKLKMPNNIRIVGTLNMDETTKELSPKVLDRSFVIEITNQKEEEIDYDANILPVLFTSKDLKLEINNVDLYKDIQKILQTFNNEWFDKLGVKISSRGFSKIKEYTASSLMADSTNTSIDKIIDFIIVSKVLPRINFYKDNEKSTKYLAFESLYKYIESEKDNYPITYNKLDRMYKICNDTNIATFWE